MKALVVVACGLQKLWLLGSRAQTQYLWCTDLVARGMWDFPSPGIKSVSPALAGGFFTTEPPGKPCILFSQHSWFVDGSFSCFPRTFFKLIKAIFSIISRNFMWQVGYRCMCLVGYFDPISIKYVSVCVCMREREREILHYLLFHFSDYSFLLQKK